MTNFIRGPSGRTPWALVVVGITLSLPAPSVAQSNVDRGVADGMRVRIGPAAATLPMRVGAPQPSWESPVVHDLPRPAEFDRYRRLARRRAGAVDGRPWRGDDPHPLRGALATIGGMLAGFGVGLAVDEPAAGLIVGTGLGLVTTAVLRTFGDR